VQINDRSPKTPSQYPREVMVPSSLWRENTGEPFMSDYVLVPRRHLRKTDVTPIELERFKRNHPEVAKSFGVKTGA
jgi:hypothetical protein